MTEEQLTAVRWALERGFMYHDYNEYFFPTNTVGRAELAFTLYRALGRPETSAVLFPYTDMYYGDNWLPAVSWAAEQPGIRFVCRQPDRLDPYSDAEPIIVNYFYSTANGEKQLIDVTIQVGCDEHEWDAGVRHEPTCTADGYITYTCQLCGAVRNEQSGAKATGHNWGAWQRTTEPTCTQSGTEQRVCKNDSSHVEKRSVDPLGHDWTDWSTLTPATEQTDGVAVRVCKHDNSHTEYKTIEKLKPGSDDTKPSPKPDDTKPSPKPDDTKPSPKPDDTKPTPKPALNNPFTDVKSGDYFFDPVLWALNHDPQITDGMTETTFAPGETCTRGQVVTFLWRSMGCAEPKSTNNPFSDVKDSDYFYKAVLWAVEKGITDGTSDTTFSPNDPCTRAHVVTFLHRAENKPAAGSDNPFADVASGQYYYDAVLWAVSKQITDGTSDTTFSPNDPCTRGQIVTFLYRDMK